MSAPIDRAAAVRAALRSLVAHNMRHSIEDDRLSPHGTKHGGHIPYGGTSFVCQ